MGSGEWGRGRDEGEGVCVGSEGGGKWGEGDRGGGIVREWGRLVEGIGIVERGCIGVGMLWEMCGGVL